MKINKRESLLKYVNDSDNWTYQGSAYQKKHKGNKYQCVGYFLDGIFHYFWRNNFGEEGIEIEYEYE